MKADETRRSDPPIFNAVGLVETCLLRSRSFLCLSALLLLVGFGRPAFGTDWFVAPVSSSSGNGTMETPWTIETALSHPEAVQPGDRIWLRGGTYAGIFLSELTGTAERPIVVRNYNNEPVTLDANVRTTLARPIDAGTSTMTLADASAINVRPGMLLLIENNPEESVWVTAISGNKVMVTRGQNGTAAREHVAGTSVRPADQALLTVEGAYTWFWGLEFTNTDLARVTDVTGSHPYNARNGGLNVVDGQGIRVINTIWHDLGSGLGVWKTAANFVGYGNLIYNNGWDSPDRLHGHGIYTQNNTSNRLFSDNIVWSSFMNSINQYGSSNAVLDNITWVGNVLYGRRILFGGDAPVRNLTLRNNFFYDMAPDLGYASRENVGLILKNNYIPVPFMIKWWTNVQASGNTIFNRSYSWQLDLIFDREPPPAALATYRFQKNRYYYSSPSPVYHKEWPAQWRVSKTGEGGRKLFSEWQALGQDVDSTVTMVPRDTFGGKPRMVMPSPVIFLRKNAYDMNRAHLIIYNWANADKVAVTAQKLGGFMNAGDKYRLSNVQDYFADRELGTYDGSAIKIAMTGRSVAKPIGYDSVAAWYNGPPPITSTFPEFGVFVLERVGARY